MPEQSQGVPGSTPASAVNNQNMPDGSTPAPEQPGVPQADAENQKPAEQTAVPATENKSGEEINKLYRENQSYKDKLASLEDKMSKQKELMQSYVPEAELETIERKDIESERKKLEQEKQDIERSRILEEKLKLPEYQGLESFRGDIKGVTEEEIVQELNGCRAKVEAWKDRGSAQADLPSAGGAKTSVGIPSEGVDKMSVAELEKVLPKG